MTSAIVVHPDFEASWPFAADRAHDIWTAQGDVAFVRAAPGDRHPVSELLPAPAKVKRLLALGVPLTERCISAMPELREAAASFTGEGTFERLVARGVHVIRHQSEGFWGQSVAEFGLALTLSALRRIPQTHRNIITSQSDWDYTPGGGSGRSGVRADQFGDDLNFTCGTLAGKRVRIVGAGNIASRYASFAHFLGADVAAWDPFASDPCFHRSGARREHFLDRLVRDAEIFAPMLPLTDETRGIITPDHLQALPRGAIVVLITRANIVDMPTLRRRVLNDELALAADVFDVEPLDLHDPLLGRHNVIHTPHNAGRTRHANERFVEMLTDQFEPVR